MRFGVVGTNFVSDFFMSGVKEVPEIQVVGVCSGRKENAVKFAGKYEIEHVFDDYIQMIESKEIDAIYLAVPNHMHYEMTCECMRRNMPTLTEKPFATNYKEAKEMIELSRENKTYLQDGLIPLYTENLQIVKSAMGSIGKIRRAIFNFSKYSSRYDAYLKGENPTTFRREMSNGSLMDLGIYAIGDAVALFGKPTKILATGILLDSGVDGLGTCIFQYDGFEVTVQHSKISDTEIVSEIQGEEGLIQINLLSRVQDVWVTSRNKSEGCTLGVKQGVKTLVSKPSCEGFTYQLRDFVKNVELGNTESEIFPHQLTLDILEVCTECRRQMGVIYPADEK